MKALQYSDFGPADVLRWEDLSTPTPSSTSVLVRVEAAGLNYADIYRRQGRFTPAGPPPWIPGMEGAGTILDLGEAGSAAGLRPGQRVGWCDNASSCAEIVAVEIDKIIPLPDTIPTALAAGILLQGLTADYLVRDSHPIRPGEWCVVHAAGGGVGLLLTQMIRHLGGRVIALASSSEKQQAARDAGAEYAFNSDEWVTRVRQITDEGADVVFDSVGTTILDSLAATRDCGHVIFFGMAGGEPPTIKPLTLLERSLTLTGGDLWNVLTRRQERLQRADRLFDLIENKIITPRIAKAFDISAAAEAHRYLESRTSIGKVILTTSRAN